MSWPRSGWWTPEREAEARRLYLDEGRSAAAVARLLGAPSRNTIIGKAYRSGWKLPQDRARPRGQGLRAPRAPPKPPGRQALRARTEARRLPAPSLPVSALPLAAALPPGAAPVAFMARPAGRCCWPIGAEREPAGAEMLVCGAPALPGAWQPYCQIHLALGLQPRGQAA
ncbi:MAG: hypothetical protein JO127_04820 [Caulobacteraceae bacterium]|nr:hypothetical protein [Caulobacteraceae bacterium]